MWTSSHTRSFIKRLAWAGVSISAFSVGCLSAQPKGVVLFVSGDSRGYLEPCGCRRDQAGGLAGRARAIRQVPGGERVVFDVGDMLSGTRDYDMLKMKYMLRGMELIGYDAVNLGEKEAELDVDKLRALLKSSTLPFVSANVVVKSDKKPLTDRFRLVKRGGLTLGVIGVTNCRPEDAGPGVEVRPIMESLAEVVPSVKPQCDFLIVLAFSDEDTIKEIASKFHEVNCILGGDVQQSSGEVQNVNRASVFNVTDKGKVIGRLGLRPSGGGFVIDEGLAIRIAADKQEGPEEFDKLLGDYKQELRDRRYELASVEGMERIAGSEGTANEYVGDASCVSCHQSAHEKWISTAHSHAFSTLKKAKSEYDPDCLRCHSVAYGLASGFIDEAKTPSLENVQCESCHGRGKEHMASKSKASLKPVTPATCVKCHDTENSENFKYATFWPKITH